MSFRLAIRIPGPVNGFQPALAGVAGVPVLLRLLIGAVRNGAEQIEVTGSDVEAARRTVGSDRRLAGADISWGPHPAPKVDFVQVEVDADVVVGNSVWKDLDAADGPVTVPGAPRFFKNDGAGTQPVPLWTGETPSRTHFVVPVRERPDIRRAKSAIFRSVFKPTSGPVSVHFNSKLSIPVSWVLSETGVTPNMITVATTLLGFVSAWMFVRGDLWGFFWGGTIFQLCAAFDRCDGEIARSKFMDSPSGAWVDTFGDNITYIAYLSALTLGYAKFSAAGGHFWAPYVHYLGFGSLALTVFLLGGMYLYLYRNKKSGTLVAVYKDFEARVDGRKAGIAYRLLDRIKILGKRDSWSLAIGVAAWLGYLLDAPFFYHLVFFATVGTIILMNVYFSVARKSLGG